MQAVIDITDQDIYTDVRQFILLNFRGEVVQPYDNNVPMPNGDHVLMKILFKTQLATNNNEYNIEDDNAKIQQSTQVDMQLDFYGESSDQAAQIFVNLWRDFYGTEHLSVVQPLYCSDARLMPIINEAKHYENRYVVTAAMQCNPVATIDHPFVDEIVVEQKRVN